VFQVNAATTDPCDAENDFICDWVYDATENEALAEAINWFVERPLKVVLILLVAWGLNRLVGRAIARGESRMVVASEKKLREHQSELADAGGIGPPEGEERRRSIEMTQATNEAKQRARTIASILRSASTAVIYTIAILMALGEFDVNLGPLLAGAGIAGIAIGFGAQSIVKDFLTGFFMLVEDQYHVGDGVDLGEASGTVEEISLRTTKLRDVNGTLWYIPNGEIRRVGNHSQQWARVVLDIEVAFGTDLERASQVIKEVADSVWSEHVAKATIIEEPEIWGVERFGESAIVMRLACKVEPGEQSATARLIRARLIAAFEREGIEIPFPQRVVWTKEAPDHSAAAPSPLDPEME
jgi:small conductance mechanosensitive channel